MTKKEMEKITPEEYSEILKGIQLVNISLLKLNSSIDKKNFGDKLTIDIKVEMSYEKVSGGFFSVSAYKITAKNKNDEITLEFEITYRADFNSVKEITDSFFEVYKNVSLPLNTWPFVRELVNSTTARMNIPPLTLPLFKVGK
ncbi:MAG TPA: protein-export chaperone SecB [Clostridiales bacterium]|nr:protein-export chaperone SecB [Clostridiales bacterium]